ncbi:germ cell nuclear acidic protein isoform X2 [Drosophila kikkawai]|uniref:Germ cell nuclear acidic protein isoform X2 n=1 Tax=Drosophila kikkawai TaxID=30033 RepID=A0A6P4J112_DROKI|nr:uncharacterized protein LOC108079221 isoform X2 [Drosophila kikkawai]
MSTNKGRDSSLTDVFGTLQLSDTESLSAQQEDSCKMPQSDPNDSIGDSFVNVVDSDESSVVSYIYSVDLVSPESSLCEDNNSNDNILYTTNDDSSDGSDINVVDTDESSVVSYIDPADLGITIEETSESEAADEHGPGLSPPTRTATSGADMDTPQSSKSSKSSNSSKSSLKRSSNSLSDDDTQAKKCSLDAISGSVLAASRSGLKRTSPFSLGKDIPAKKPMKEMVAFSSSPKIVTRSGRAVRMCLDKKFDYSSSQPEDDETEDSLDSSATDSDDEFQLNGSHEELNWSSRKRRRSSHGSNRTSTSSSSSSQLEATLIYLDLEPPVATIMDEPFADLVLEDDADLKTKMHKFLGLIPRRRKLYNPEDQLYLEPDEPPHKETAPSRSFLFITSPVQPQSQPPSPHVLHVPPSPKKLPIRSPMILNTSQLQSLTLEERKTKMLDDTMLLVNAATLETETPDYIKAPIDLRELPSEKWRANNCRRHKACIACLEQHPLLYSFVDSLNPATSIKLCHPQALAYRGSDFESSKQALAKLLFNVFNHAVFHCALQPNIVWKRSLGKPCRCEMIIDSSGQRTTRLLLWNNINSPGRLIKPLIHEMCHAAAYVFNRETGHGEACRQWAYQANQQLFELTQIDACDAAYKYVCSMCGRGSYGLMDFAGSKDMLRCHYCQFEVVVEPWSVDDKYDGIRPDTTLTEFKTFIFEKYQQLAEQEHSSKMRCLNQQYLDMQLRAACD